MSRNIPHRPEKLAHGTASVQEIVLVALAVILSQVEYDQDQVVNLIRQVQLEAGKYIKKVWEYSELGQADD